MKIEELRIGNLVKDCDSETAHIIKQFIRRENGANLHLDEEHLLCHITNAIPIPLTKNELRKFGCKQGYWYISVPNLKAELHFEFYGNEIVTTLKSQFSDLILDPIKYVHKLQNLYFALANEELKCVDGF